MILSKLIIIPAYNEQKNIHNVVKDITENAPDFDYIIINDSSTDLTYDICKKNGYNVLCLPVNLGIGGAVQTGYKYAYKYGYDIAIQFDGDGQHDAKYLDEMVRYLNDNNLDMVIGSRFINKEGFQSSITRRIGINFLSYLIKKITGQKVLDVTSGYRVVNKKIINEFCNYYPKDYPEPETIASVLRCGGKIGEIPVKMKAREYGKSSINLSKSIYYMIKVSLAIVFDIIKPKGVLNNGN